MKKIISRYLAILLLLATIIVSCDKYEQEEKQNKASLVETLSKNPDLIIFYKALESTGLDKSLDSLSKIIPLTIFAPNNNALEIYFEKNGYSTVDQVPKLELKKIILGYIIPGIKRVERIVVDPMNPSSDLDETIGAEYLESKTYVSIASLFKDFESMDNSLIIGIQDNYDRSIQTLTIAGESVAASAKDITSENAIIHIVGNLGSLPKAPFINSISNKYPVSGEIVTVTGINFYNTPLVTLGSANLDIIPGTLTTTKFDVKIPSNFEYGLLTVKTNYGKSNQVKVGIEPAPPTINSFSPINAVSGDEVTISGDGFISPIVTLSATATQPEISLTIVHYTLDKIVVKIPENANHRKISVTNSVGTGTAVEAIGTALYDDELRGVQWGGPWSGQGVDLNYGGDSYQGTKSWRWVFGGWDGGNWGFYFDMSPYKSLRIAVKGSKNGQVNFNVNGGTNFVIPVTTSWVYMEIPLSALGSPSSLTMLTFQESNNDGGNTVLFDNIGFVLK
ncbi:fasciclin domain-containing protein [Flavobacterium sp.]|uniref:fasciclin domain-containing protein n=1 Tax=Flavobacterium sp. TaxID=239 RepID=UPI0032669571